MVVHLMIFVNWNLSSNWTFQTNPNIIRVQKILKPPATVQGDIRKAKKFERRFEAKTGWFQGQTPPTIKRNKSALFCRESLGKQNRCTAVSCFSMSCLSPRWQELLSFSSSLSRRLFSCVSHCFFNYSLASQTQLWQTRSCWSAHRVQTRPRCVVMAHLKE